MRQEEQLPCWSCELFLITLSLLPDARQFYHVAVGTVLICQKASGIWPGNHHTGPSEDAFKQSQCMRETLLGISKMQASLNPTPSPQFQIVILIQTVMLHIWQSQQWLLLARSAILSGLQALDQCEEHACSYLSGVLQRIKKRGGSPSNSSTLCFDPLMSSLHKL